jgi:predicted GNAT family N-acyltransferase
MNTIVICLAQPTDFPAIQHIRQQVFQLEQDVPAALEFDGKDETAQQFLAYLNGQPVGTARVRLLDQTAKVERVAVLSAARGQGIGKAIMAKVLEFLVDAAIPTVQIHAQTRVQDFYEKLGFEPEGEVFTEAGIPHVKMRRLLREPG